MLMAIMPYIPLVGDVYSSGCKNAAHKEADILG